MKIHSIKVSHIKKCIDVEFAFDDTLIKVSGKNGAGKSTIIESIFLAIVGKTFIGRGKSIESIITHGYTQGMIECVLKDTNKTITVNRKITTKGNVYLDVESSDGAKLTQKDLDGLLSEFTIDPLEFTRLPMKEQYDIVKNVVGLDTKDLDASIEKQKLLSQDKRAVYSSLKKTVDLMGEPMQPESAELDIVSLSEKQREITEGLQKVDIMERSMKDLESKRIDTDNQIERLMQQLDELRTKKTSIASSIADLTMKLVGMDERKQKAQEDLSLINTSIVNYKDNQNLWTEYNRYVEYKKQLTDATDELDASEKVLDKIKEERKRIIRNTNIPIPFLKFTDDDGLEINGTPISMLSSAEQIVLACRIATVRNPLLKVVYIKDASLLDEDSMAYLQTIAEEFDYQIFAERVGEESGTLIMREGEIVA